MRRNQEPLPTNDNKRLALEVLGLHFGATPKDLRAAYHKKALMFHPDKGGDAKDFIALKTAYDWLGVHGTEKFARQYVQKAQQAGYSVSFDDSVTIHQYGNGFVTIKIVVS